MGVIRRAIHLFFGPGVNKLLDITNTCRCIGCCAREVWQPCDNKTKDGKPECGWCVAANAGQYVHCHGIGNAALRAGWRLEGPIRNPKQ